MININIMTCWNTVINTIYIILHITYIWIKLELIRNLLIGVMIIGFWYVIGAIGLTLFALYTYDKKYNLFENAFMIGIVFGIRDNWSIYCHFEQKINETMGHNKFFKQIEIIKTKMLGWILSIVMRIIQIRMREDGTIQSMLDVAGINAELVNTDHHRIMDLDGNFIQQLVTMQPVVVADHSGIVNLNENFIQQLGTIMQPVVSMELGENEPENEDELIETGEKYIDYISKKHKCIDVELEEHKEHDFI